MGTAVRVDIWPPCLDGMKHGAAMDDALDGDTEKHQLEKGAERRW
jgi:hypothetical protein